jgi:peptidoglycan hydrolase-like protein with peptidoglycan-binding domain
VKRKVFTLAALALCTIGTARADDNVAKAQDRLAADGFFQGTSTGVYDSETAAAVTRFQIRNGLAISGKLDAPTAKALGVSPVTVEAEPRVLTGSWKRLRNGGYQFLPKATPSSSVSRAAASAAASSPIRTASSPTPPLAATSPAVIAAAVDSDRLRDYVAAFVLAGLDPHVGSELEFFASHVDYFGATNVSRDRIQQDLLRYDHQWPERRFWLDGDIQIPPQSINAVKVIFPLRYELRNGQKRASGKVLKTLTLMKLSGNQLQIIVVNERKL